MDDQPVRRLSKKEKLAITALFSLLWVFVAISNSTEFDNLDMIEKDSSIQYIFQTTIAVETRRFQKKIVEEAKGVWSYLPLLENKRWVQLDIELQTRIGFKMKPESVSITVNKYNDINLQILDLVILSKRWTSTIVDRSNDIFKQWDIIQFQSKQKEMLQNIIESESQLQLYDFKLDESRVNGLVRRLQNQMNPNRFHILQWPSRVMRLINQYANKRLDLIVSDVVKYLYGKNKSGYYEQYVIGNQKTNKTYKKKQVVPPKYQHLQKLQELKPVTTTKQQSKAKHKMKSNLDI